MLFPRHGKLEVAEETECEVAKRKFICYEGADEESGRDWLYYVIIVSMALITCLGCFIIIKCLTAQTKSSRRRKDSEAGAPLMMVGRDMSGANSDQF